MKTRVAAIILILVVLPAAVLSILAARSLKNRELVMQAQLEVRAAKAIQAVSGSLKADLSETLENIRAIVADTISGGAGYNQLDGTAEKARQAQPLVDAVYLFLRPWGFMYPQEHPASRTGAAAVYSGQQLRPGWDYFPSSQWDGKDVALSEEARKQFAAADTDQYLFNVGDAGYCFKRLSAGRALYAGFRVNKDEYNNRLSGYMGANTGAGFSLIVTESDRPDSDIIISDSFSSKIASESEMQHGQDQQPLAVGRVGAPFREMLIKAFAEDPEAAAASARIYNRLFAWSIVLMVTALCVGVWMLVREAAREVQLARARADFVVGVSHDLRTPISSVKMLAESLYLDNVEGEGKRKKFLETIARESDRLADMVERVLFFVREEHGASVYKMEECAVGDLVRDVAKAFEERKHGDVRLAVGVPGDLPSVQADGDAVIKVVSNLLDNAEKYSRRADPEGPVRIEIEGRLDRARGREWVTISVRDHGIGISAKEQKKVFRRFYRADIEKDGKVGGIGLGLSLCNSIAAAHGGKMTVESEPGKGSRFTLWLPVRG